MKLCLFIFRIPFPSKSNCPDNCLNKRNAARNGTIFVKKILNSLRVTFMSRDALEGNHFKSFQRRKIKTIRMCERKRKNKGKFLLV